MSKKSANMGSVPESVINQVNEYTLGGFILFYFNSETGEPEQIMTFDTPAHSIALQKYISDWARAVDKVNLDNSVSSIKRDFSGIDEEEEE